MPILCHYIPGLEGVHERCGYFWSNQWSCVGSLGLPHGLQLPMTAVSTPRNLTLWDCSFGACLDHWVESLGLSGHLPIYLVTVSPGPRGFHGDPEDPGLPFPSALPSFSSRSFFNAASG